MSNPFKKIAKNAETSKSEAYNKGLRSQTVISSKQCNSCGAPRPKNANLEKCEYCRLPFMVHVQNLKADF